MVQNRTFYSKHLFKRITLYDDRNTPGLRVYIELRTIMRNDMLTIKCFNIYHTTRVFYLLMPTGVEINNK